MKNLIVLPFVLVLLWQPQKIVAQSALDRDSTYISADINFISDAVYMGRKDSISAPYLFPSITYHHTSGFYAMGSFSYLTRSNENRIDLFLITAGFDFIAKHLQGDISATKYFFNDDSYNVISEIEADITAYITYDFKIMNISATSIIYVNNGNNSDFFLGVDVSKDFISINEKFQVSPTAGTNFGTQNFYEQYYTTSRFGNRRGQGQGNNSSTQSTTNIVIEDSEKFDLMVFELSLPIWYTHNSFTFSFLPVLALPQSEASLIIDDTIINEKLEDTFYWTLGISYKF